MIRGGAYVDLPAGEPFRALHTRTRSLTGLLSDLGKHAEHELTVAVPFLTATVLEDWLSTWTRDHPALRVTVIHRQVPSSRAEGHRLSTVLRKWSDTARVSFKTFPARDPRTWQLLPGPTFHCKLIEVDKSHLLVMSANLNEHSRSQNAEVGYVFGPREARDLRRFLRSLERASTPDSLVDGA